jgi:hypothetical protein
VDRQEKRLHRGDVREDGMMFWQYLKKAPNGEYWVSKERYQSLKETVKRCSKYTPIDLRKHRRGDIRSDGLIFWGYKKRANNGELWLNKEKFIKEQDTQRKALRKYAKNNKEEERARINDVNCKRKAIKKQFILLFRQ